MLCKNFLAHLIDLFLSEDKSRKSSHIYGKIKGMSRQHFYGLNDPDRVPSPHKWKIIRKALGMSRKAFWNAAMEFHDPLEDKPKKE